MSDVTFDMENNSMNVHEKRTEPWKVTIVDTGDETMTGGRLLKVRRLPGSRRTLLFYLRGRRLGRRSDQVDRLPP